MEEMMQQRQAMVDQMEAHRREEDAYRVARQPAKARKAIKAAYAMDAAINTFDTEHPEVRIAVIEAGMIEFMQRTAKH